jgi:excisionase family DNA binding protein
MKLNIFNKKEDKLENSSSITDYLDLSEVEKLTNIRVDKLRKMARNGEMNAVRIGGTRGPWLMHTSELKKLIDIK